MRLISPSYFYQRMVTNLVILFLLFFFYYSKIPKRPPVFMPWILPSSTVSGTHSYQDRYL